MSTHTFCRAKPQKQLPCSASDALATVQGLLDKSSSSLPDDLRANLYRLEEELKVIEEISKAVSGLGAAAQPNPAAKTAHKEVAAKPAAAAAKEPRADKKVKEGSGAAEKSAGKKEQKKEKRKRTSEIGDADEGKDARKGKKQKT